MLPLKEVNNHKKPLKLAKNKGALMIIFLADL